MKPLVIVEAEADRLLLTKVLDADPATRGRYAVQAAGGKSSAVSLARTYLATTDRHVIVVLDADSVDRAKVADEHGVATHLLMSAGRRDQFDLVMAVPSLESILFPDRRTAAAVIGRPLTDAEWTEAGAAPRRLLAKLVAADSPSTLAGWLARRDMSALTESPLIRAVRESIVAPAVA